MKTIGIIGAGNIGKAIAAHLLNKGIPVLISNSKGPDTLLPVVAKLGKAARAVDTKEAAAADIVILALPYAQIKNIAPVTNWQGKIVIDATNHFNASGQLEDTHGLSSSEVVKGLLPGAKLVKAFNTLFASVLAAEPSVGKGRRVLFISGDDGAAKSIVSNISTTMGFAAIDLGGLAEGGRLQQAGGVFSGLNLIKE